MNQEIFLILARAENGMIGREGGIPWHIPADLKRFKALTMGKPMIMGRKTFDSIGRALPGRRNIVLSRTMQAQEGVEVIRDLSELRCENDEQVFLIGGAQLFESMLPVCAGMYLTYIEKAYEGDVHFPPFDHLFEVPEVVGQGEGIEFRYYRRKAAV